MNHTDPDESRHRAQGCVVLATFAAISALAVITGIYKLITMLI